MGGGQDKGDDVRPDWPKLSLRTDTGSWSRQTLPSHKKCRSGELVKPEIGELVKEGH